MIFNRLSLTLYRERSYRTKLKQLGILRKEKMNEERPSKHGENDSLHDSAFADEELPCQPNVPTSPAPFRVNSSPPSSGKQPRRPSPPEVNATEDDVSELDFLSHLNMYHTRARSDRRCLYPERGRDWILEGTKTVRASQSHKRPTTSGAATEHVKACVEDGYLDERAFNTVLQHGTEAMGLLGLDGVVKSHQKRDRMYVDAVERKVLQLNEEAAKESFNRQKVIDTEVNQQVSEYARQSLQYINPTACQHWNGDADPPWFGGSSVSPDMRKS
jgi:hypothetical protein